MSCLCPPITRLSTPLYVVNLNVCVCVFFFLRFFRLSGPFLQLAEMGACGGAAAAGAAAVSAATGPATEVPARKFAARRRRRRRRLAAAARVGVVVEEAGTERWRRRQFGEQRTRQKLPLSVLRGVCLSWRLCSCASTRALPASTSVTPPRHHRHRCRSHRRRRRARGQVAAAVHTTAVGATVCRPWSFSTPPS